MELMCRWWAEQKSSKNTHALAHTHTHAHTHTYVHTYAHTYTHTYNTNGMGGGGESCRIERGDGCEGK